MQHSKKRLSNRTLAVILSLAMTFPFVIPNNFDTENKTVKAAETDLTYGDVTGDGKIDILDLIFLKSYVNENSPKDFSEKTADLNNDKSVSSRDAVELSLYLLNQVDTFSYETEIDTDSDGLCDYIEKELLNTDYLKKDTDGDGLDDYSEVYLCDTDPLKADTDDSGVNDSLKDPDNDKLTNADEIKLETSPLLSDSDDDGIGDYDEVNKYKTDPLLADTDGDEISDYGEIQLDLDPLKKSSDGKSSDTERTFEQSLTADNAMLSSLNSNNPYKLAIDIQASGYIEESLTVQESAYSNSIQNENITGNIIDIDYADNMKTDSITVKFTVTENAEDYLIFRYYKDVNMLLPAVTEYDGNTVFTESDEDGTFCIVNMADQSAVTSALQSAYSGEVYSASESSELIEVYFLMYISSTSTDSARKAAATASRAIIDYCSKNGKNAKIYYASYTGNTVVSKDSGLSYVTNFSTDEEIAEMLSRSGSASGALDTSDFNYSLTRTLKKSLLSISGNDKTSKKYCFIIDVNFQPSCASNIAVVDEMKANGVDFTFICNTHNDNEGMYDTLSTDGTHIEWKPDYSDSVIEKVIGKQNETLAYNYDTGLFNSVAISKEITYDWYRAAKGELTPEEIEALGLPDTDGDGVYDFEEINWDYVTIKDGKIIFPSYEEICDLFPSAKKGLTGLKSKLNYSDSNVLVLKSDPSSLDTDNDGLLDGKPIYYNGEIIAPKDSDPVHYNGPKNLWKKHIENTKDSSIPTELTHWYAYEGEKGKLNIGVEGFSVLSDEIDKLLDEKPELKKTDFKLYMFKALTFSALELYDPAQESFYKAIEELGKAIPTDELKKVAAELGSAFLNFKADGKNVLHSQYFQWQAVGGYNNMYDRLFSLFTRKNMDMIKLPFEYDGIEYIFWGWRGDYLNIGAGSELGIYSRPKILHQDETKLDHYFVDLKNSMNMELHLYNYENPNKISVNYSWKPTVLQWWVCGWNPEYAWNVDVQKLAVVSKVDMSEFKELYNVFARNYKTDEDYTPYLEFDDEHNLFWLMWGDDSLYELP